MSTDEENNDKYRIAIEEAAKEYVGVVHKSVDFFEKQLSYISAGALGLSFIIVEKIFGDISQTHCKGILICSWVLLTLTLIVNLFSHSYATKCHLKTVEEMYAFTSGNVEEYDDCNTRNRSRKISRLNDISLLLLSLGIVLLILYTSINITKMPDEKDKLPKSPNKERQLPDLNDKKSALNEGKAPRDSKVHEIRDGGHPGIPTKKPGKKD